MPDHANPATPQSLDLKSRCVRYAQLRPCTTAFIDARTPGSARKENFTIIGPGVSENPDQYVHIDLPHGFNIGAARQPPCCVNSQHSHETAEVFVVHTGRWAFYLGEDCSDARVVLEPGDAISIPVHVFRGFENIGDDTGFMFAVLGGDDPGHVMWAPYVFEQARKHGLILLEDGSLVDTQRGETIPAGKRPQQPTSAAQVASLNRMTAVQFERCVARCCTLQPSASRLAWAGMDEAPIIGSASAREGIKAGKMAWPHGFHVRRLSVAPGARSRRHMRSEEEVLLMHEGELTVDCGDQSITLGPGDVLTVPIDAPRRFGNNGLVPAQVYAVRGGDAPGAAAFTD